jgi:hypothetical protein
MHTSLKQAIVLQSDDRWLGYIGVALGTALALILLAIGLYQPLGLAVTIQTTSLGYLLLKERLSIPSLAQREGVLAGPTPRWSVFLTGLLPIVVAVVAWQVISVCTGALQRPLWVFLVLAGIPGLILAQKTLFPKTGDTEMSFVVQVLILVVAIVLSSVTVFPHNGGDTWAHLHNARVILENQGVDGIQDTYRDYPLYPALISILSASTGWEAAEAARLLNVFIAIVSLLLLYSLSRQFHTPLENLALLLLLLGSKWFMHWTTLVVSMNTAMLFYCLLVVVLFRRLHKKMDTKEAIAMFLITGMIPFFHPVGSMATIFLLIGFWALERTRVHDVVGRRPLSQRSLIGFALLVFIFTLTQWMYYGDFVFDRTVKGLAHAIFADSSSIQLASSHRDVLVYTLDQLNFYALLGLAGLEMIRQIWRRTDRLNLYASLLGLAFVLFGYATQAMNLLGIMPYRWFLFGNLLLVFPASSAFANLFQRRSYWVRIAAVGMIVLYFFTGLTNTEVNRDRPLYGKEITQLFELTSSEYAGLLTLQEAMQQRDVRVRVDFRLWDYLKYVPGNERTGYWHQIQLDGFDGIFALRAAYLDRLFLVNGSAAELDLQQPNLSQFYDSGRMQLLDHVDE